MQQVIGRDPDIMGGLPCFRGTRVPFKNLIDYLEGNHSLGEFVAQFPSVTQEMAVLALEQAKESLWRGSLEDSVRRVPAAGFSTQLSARSGRLKGGCGHDWPPHKLLQTNRAGYCGADESLAQ
jgi:uncharacterized protein (DUF433 family)